VTDAHPNSQDGDKREWPRGDQQDALAAVMHRALNCSLERLAAMLLYETLVIDAMTSEPFTEDSELGTFGPVAATLEMRSKVGTRTLDKRSVRRTKMVVGLRVPQPQSQAPDLLVHTLDISSSGAKIGAVREWIQPGSVLVIQYKHNRAQCRVRWSRQIAPREIQIGIEFLGRDPQIWGLDLDEDCTGVWLSSSER
jgi:hypothetical protein